MMPAGTRVQRTTARTIGLLYSRAHKMRQEAERTISAQAIVDIDIVAEIFHGARD